MTHLFPSKNMLRLVLLLNALIPLAFSITLFDWTILIVNDSKDQTLTTHCETNGDDIGTKALNPSTKQAFVCPVLVKERTVASCDITLGNLHGRFDVLDWDRDQRRCVDGACLWHVDENGLFLVINCQLVLQYPWPN
ncbi:uncharacterized protein LOC105172042 [Sesamum indicum]|uniref:Uncharacterized protein LOC105172042 n=1 Tax=Sesamum indicum TaxID=4182 RepID=A0A6I9TWW5_SESIN|nr:uncharacterized protein LOC105172042 [Sesamum indicum]